MSIDDSRCSTRSTWRVTIHQRRRRERRGLAVQVGAEDEKRLAVLHRLAFLDQHCFEEAWAGGVDGGGDAEGVDKAQDLAGRHAITGVRRGSGLVRVVKEANPIGED